MEERTVGKSRHKSNECTDIALEHEVLLSACATPACVQQVDVQNFRVAIRCPARTTEWTGLGALTVFIATPCNGQRSVREGEALPHQLRQQRPSTMLQITRELQNDWFACPGSKKGRAHCPAVFLSVVVPLEGWLCPHEPSRAFSGSITDTFAKIREKHDFFVFESRSTVTLQLAGSSRRPKLFFFLATPWSARGLS